MYNYVRSINQEVLDRINEPRRLIQVIAGPRQVGKSTMVHQVLSQVKIPYLSENADAVDAADSDWIRRVWNTARNKMLVLNLSEFLLVIDEIQKIRNWSEVVKREWDADSLNGVNIKVILLGSSRLMLRKGLTESLAGRFELIRMSHWSYQEMRDAFGFTLDQYIYFGGYPGAAPFISNEKRWRRYIKDALVAPAIGKDVILTSNIYKPALMQQVFEIGCSYSAQLLSLTKIVGQLQDVGNATTVAHYISLLNQSELLTGLQKYVFDEARKYNSVPKFQVYNNALLTAYRGKNYETDRTNPDVWGRWVESAVGAHLVCRANELDYRVLYWRERNDEVDFIVYGQGKCISIEVKSGRHAKNKGMKLFHDLYQPQMEFIVGTTGMPVEEFLLTDLEHFF